MLPDGLQIRDFRIIRSLGMGGMGEIYLAENIHIRQQVAIKVIRLEITSTPGSSTAQEMLERFRREAKAIARLEEHPHILRLLYFGEINIHGTICPYLVTQYCPEGSLKKWVEQYRSTNTLSVEDIAHFLNQAASALQYAHNNGIIHRDVKPANFLVLKNSNSHLPDLLLADFGLTRFMAESSRLTKRPLGTAAYMPPEQWNSTPTYATDQYALAIMAYELLTGRPPFLGGLEHVMVQHLYAKPRPPSQLNRNIPPLLDDVILRALEKKPEDRYPSTTDFARDFQQAIAPSVVAPEPLFISLTISKSEAQAGTTRTLTLQDGRHVAMRVPPNTHNGQTIRLDAQDAGTRGPLVVTISVKPDNPLTPITNAIIRRSQAMLKSPWQRALLIGLAILLILGSTVSLFAHPPNTPPSDAHATETAIAATHIAMLTAQAHATQTAQANETATAIAYANETATAIALHYPYSALSPAILLGPNGNSNYNPDSWESSSGTTYLCKFTGVTEEVSESDPKKFSTCFERNIDFSDFTYEVQMKITKGDCGGIAFRADASEANFYMLVVCQDGSYALYPVVNNMSQKAITSNTSSNIDKGTNRINTIAIVAQGSTFKLYVNPSKNNPTPIDTISGTTFSQGGRVGLVAFPFSHPTDVLYMNAKVWQLVI